MIIKNVTLKRSAASQAPLPKNEHMEVAFAGKSNVGKSSMINALMNRKALARMRGKDPDYQLLQCQQ